jgi:hypothetical protein
MHHDAALAALEARRDRLLELLDAAHARYERSLTLAKRGKVIAEEAQPAVRRRPRSGMRKRPGPQMD